MDLQHVIILRKNELTRLLAGCTAIDPVWMLPKMENLPDDLLTDNIARKFIQAVRAKLPELQATSDDDQCRMVVKVAGDQGVLSDYCQWIFKPTNLYEDGPAAIQELKRLSITLDTLTGLQGWISNIEDLTAWH